MGYAVIQQLTAAPNKFVEWTVQPPSRFPDGPSQVIAALLDEQTWVAVTSKSEQRVLLLDNGLAKIVLVNGGVSDRLASSIASPDPLYNGSEAMTMYGTEARNENA